MDTMPRFGRGDLRSSRSRGKSSIFNYFMLIITCMRKTVFCLLFFSFVLAPALTLSAGLVPCGGPNEPVCQLCHFFVMLRRIYDFVVYKLVPIVAVLMVVIGGFMYIIAFTGTEPQMLEKAHSLLKYVAFGLLIVYGAHLFITALLTVLGWRWGNWWQICPGYN